MVLELVCDPSERSYFPPDAEAEQKFQEIALSNGLALYSTLYGSRRRPLMSRGLPMWVSPPFCITEEQVEDLVDRLDRTLHHWEQTMQVAGRVAGVA
jgi:adenosylmethionine-8-amino-7-oxononanoate aminotransferase